MSELERFLTAKDAKQGRKERKGFPLRPCFASFAVKLPNVSQKAMT